MDHCLEAFAPGSLPGRPRRIAIVGCRAIIIITTSADSLPGTKTADQADTIATPTFLDAALECRRWRLRLIFTAAWVRCRRSWAETGTLNEVYFL